MDTETSTLAFKTAINEVKKTCPGISNIFILDENRHVITQDENTAQELIDCTADSLTSLLKTASITGGIDTLTCVGSSQKINFTRSENNYFVSIASNETDERTLTTLARVMFPSMVRLAQEVVTSRKEIAAETPKLKSAPPTPSPPPTPAPTLEAAPIARAPSAPPVPPPTIKIKQSEFDLPASEFTVENLSGINIISSDPETIYVDRALLGEWKELYGDKHIEKAMVESMETRKRFTCRFQPTKSQKFEGQSIVQIPNRIQSKLEIKKGTKVRIRPIVEDGEE